MKVMPKKPTVAPVHRGPGRPRTFGGDRFNFFPGDQIFADYESLKDRYTSAKIKPPTLSFIFREGGQQVIRRMNADLDQARKGSFHAKARK
jgi:hypothetical protein